MHEIITALIVLGLLLMIPARRLGGTHRNAIGIFIGTAGGLYVGVACFATALLMRTAQGFDPFLPWIVLMVLTSTIAGTVMASHRLGLFGIIVTAYALLPLILGLTDGAWPLVHLSCALAAGGGLAVGAAINHFSANSSARR